MIKQWEWMEYEVWKYKEGRGERMDMKNL